MFPPALIDLSTQVLGTCKARDLTIATAESCTGGLIAGTLTEIAGSSAVVDRGFVTYTNAAKSDLLGVPAALLNDPAIGAVSEPVARLMALGVLARTGAQIALSATGIAGPGGATATKPVGLVFIGCARRGRPPVVERHVFPGDRSAVRLATVTRALELCLAAAEGV
ncbi:MAG: putative competence/damage-inducible protein CinA [Pseudomonadota bacterium]|jgi:nicotinamide-nucleotide amidase